MLSRAMSNRVEEATNSNPCGFPVSGDKADRFIDKLKCDRSSFTLAAFSTRWRAQSTRIPRRTALVEPNTGATTAAATIDLVIQSVSWTTPRVHTLRL